MPFAASREDGELRLRAGSATAIRDRALAVLVGLVGQARRRNASVQWVDDPSSLADELESPRHSPRAHRAVMTLCRRRLSFRLRADEPPDHVTHPVDVGFREHQCGRKIDTSRRERVADRVFSRRPSDIRRCRERRQRA